MAKGERVGQKSGYRGYGVYPPLSLFRVEIPPPEHFEGTLFLFFILYVTPTKNAQSLAKNEKG